jgi:hypothetical protein
MRTKTIAATIVLGAAAAAAISTAPITTAQPDSVPTAQICSSSGANTTLCQSGGNAQIDTAPTIQAPPGYPYLGGLGVYHHGY